MIQENFYDEPVTHLVTAEAVRAGHPDKLCDQIADAILDAHLAQDPNARVAIEVMATCGKIIIAGEVTSKAEVAYEKIVADLFNKIRYNMDDLAFEDAEECKFELRIQEQSPDIAQAVNGKIIGAGDQGIMVGYATNETPECMPAPVVLAQRICKGLDDKRDKIPGLSADGKAQVTVLYEDGKPKAVTDVIVSVQHAENADIKELRSAIWEYVLPVAIPPRMWTNDTKVHINESGPFVLGGPAADTGVTGRKLAVDQYGPVAHIGGGALSGKDATKVDRSGAYMARHIAKCIVALELAERCEVQLAYAIGKPNPVSVMVDTMGTGFMPDNILSIAVQEAFKLDVASIIDQFELRRPIYSKLAIYGHFGRPELDLPWEKTDDKIDLMTSCVKCNRELRFNVGK